MLVTWDTQAHVRLHACGSLPLGRVDFPLQGAAQAAKGKQAAACILEVRHAVITCLCQPAGCLTGAGVSCHTSCALCC